MRRFVAWQGCDDLPQQGDGPHQGDGCRVGGKVPREASAAVRHRRIGRFLGLQEDLQLQPITLDERVRTKFAQLLSGAEALAVTPAEVPSSSVLDQLEAAHYTLWSAARDRHREDTAKRATFRLASLASSHAARLALLGEQFAKATDDRIRRMHQAQIERATAEQQRRVEDVSRAKDVTDVQAQVVAFGIMRVRR